MIQSNKLTKICIYHYFPNKNDELAVYQWAKNLLHNYNIDKRRSKIMIQKQSKKELVEQIRKL
ncbi:MAG: hypothetical protein LBV48_00555 [Mycoplasmataceae bacterium]|nr:hypothetical protein [Mycoplasmataceae bacterium]